MIEIKAKDSENSVDNLEYVEPEIWKDIEGYERYYQISDKGRVRSFHEGSGALGSKDNPYILSQHKTTDGYYFVRLAIKQNYKNRRVSRLVAKAFIPNPEDKPYVNHIDGNKENNNATNLEWCTQSENIKHAFELGLMDQSCENNSGTSLTNQQVIDIKILYKVTGLYQYEIAEMYGVNQSQISRIVNGKTWTEIELKPQ